VEISQAYDYVGISTCHNYEKLEKLRWTAALETYQAYEGGVAYQDEAQVKME